MPLPAFLASALPSLGMGALSGLGSLFGSRRPSQGAELGTQGGKSAVGEFFTGTPGQEMRFQKFTPEQQQAFSSVLQQALGGLGKQGQFDFGPIEQQAREGFAQQTVPGIAERFTSMGAGAQRSSAFPQILGQAGAGLETGLAAQKAGFGLQQQAQQQQLLQNLLGLGLTPQFETAYKPSQEGFLQSGAKGLAGLLPLLAMLRKGGQ